MVIAKEEIFGPVICAMKFKTLKKLLRELIILRMGLQQQYIPQIIQPL